jgi:hypothetical protein
MATDFICSISAASAGTDYQNPPSSQTTLILNDVAGSFSDERFVAVTEARREILDVALAAISTKSRVQAIVDPPTGVGPLPSCYSLEIVASS